MKRISTLVTALALASSLAVAQAPATHANAFQGQPKAEKAEKNERHPEIRAAMRKLEAAKDDLQKANKDFGGHREKAIDHINAAENELNQALAYDKK